MIDTHAHLYDSAFEEDFDQVVLRAKQAGIEKCILPGIDIAHHSRMMACAKKLKGYAFPAIGLHPTSVKDDWRRELDMVISTIEEDEFFAVGEIGMDCYWSKDHIKEQKEVFHSQILLADKYNLPIIIHSREATNEIFEVLDSAKKEAKNELRGVFHAYSGSFDTYERIQKYGDFYVGIGGVLTYKKASIAEVLKDIPMGRILTETDCPWLSPTPYRGKRNEISYLCAIIEKISEIKGMNIKDVQRISTENAMNLFNI